MTTLRLTPLGTNGFFATHGRETMSFLLRAGDEAVLLDAGSGAGRLAESGPAAELAGSGRLTVVLTHYHLDHLIGLPGLPAICGDLPLALFAPSRPLVDADPEEAFDRLLAPPLFPKRLDELPVAVTLTAYTDDGFRLAGLRVGVRRQRHPGGSAGLRFGDALAYVTDTAADDATADFVAGVDTLLHEVWLTGAEATDDDPALAGHSSVPQVAEIARRAGARRLLPVHHHPLRDTAALAALVDELRAAADPVEVVLPEEGRTYEVG